MPIRNHSFEIGKPVDQGFELAFIEIDPAVVRNNRFASCSKPGHLVDTCVSLSRWLEEVGQDSERLIRTTLEQGDAQLVDGFEGLFQSRDVLLQTEQNFMVVADGLDGLIEGARCSILFGEDLVDNNLVAETAPEFEKKRVESGP